MTPPEPPAFPQTGSPAQGASGIEPVAGEGLVPEPAGPTLASVGGKVAKGAAWIAGGYFGLRLLGLVNTLIVARLLAPDDFGVVAIGVTMTQLLQNISDVGVSRAVVRFDRAGRRELDTLFTLSVIRGVLIAGLLLLCSTAASDYFNDARVGPIFAAMAALAFLQTLYNPRFYEFEREISFRQEITVMTVEKIVMAAVSLTIAALTRSFWAIVLSLIVASIIRVAMTYAMRPYLPRLSLSAFREMIGFTGWLTGLGFIVALNNKLSPLALGRLLGATLTGHYTMGLTLAYLPGSDIADPVARAIYPGLSSLKASAERMRSAFLSGVAALGAIALPASIGCAFVAEEMVLVLLGRNWEDAVLVVQLVAPVVGVTSVLRLVNEYAVAQGEARRACIREALYFAIGFPALIWATQAYGFVGAVWASAASGLLHAALNALLYVQLSRRSAFDILAALARPAAATGAMALVLVAAPHLAPGLADAPALVRMLTYASIGAAAYGVALIALWRSAGSPEGPEASLIAAIRARA